MPINEAQAQVTATAYRGDGRYPPGLHDGAETGTAASGQTETALPAMEAMEETVGSDENAGKGRSEQRSSANIGIQQPRSMVELGSQSYESGDKDIEVQKDGLSIPVGTATAVPALT